LNRKAEVVSIGRLRAPAPSASTSSASARPRGSRLSNRPSPSPALRTPSNAPNGREAWQLIHDDPFDRTTSDEEIESAVAVIAARSVAPYTEVLRRLVGAEDMTESDARSFFQDVLARRREIAAALGRPVHIRVAALDLLTAQTNEPAPPTNSRARRDSHPIIVTPSLLEKAFEVATADGLTGLPQRVHFMNLLRHEQRQRKRRSVCVAYIDLDGFKRVNDEHGHARGDEVLRTLALSARSSLREGDVLARIGGDEFAVLLLGASPDEAELVVQRLRTTFEQASAPLGTSFSAGIVFAHPGERAESVVMRADQEMYVQKRRRAASLSG
jgi:diguanylate cyclase (GGDEF)-like protein